VPARALTNKKEESGVVRTAERQTIVPAFDVSQLAQDSDRWTEAEAREPAPVSEAPVAGGSVLVRAADFYWSRLGGREAVPSLKVPLEEVAERHRAHCEGFILCRVDGTATLADIIERSELPELTALSLACDLVDEGVIVVSRDAGKPAPR
jgi:hypothetical protein